MSIEFASDTEHASSVKEALQAGQIHAFPQTVSQLYLRSDPQQRADLVNQLLSNVSPEMMTSLAASIGNFSDDGTHPHVTVEQVEQIAPAQVEEIAATAEQHNPGVAAMIQAMAQAQQTQHQPQAAA